MFVDWFSQSFCRFRKDVIQSYYALFRLGDVIFVPANDDIMFFQSLNWIYGCLLNVFKLHTSDSQLCSSIKLLQGVFYIFFN